MVEEVKEPSFGAGVWHSRYGKLEGTVTRLGREVQASEVAERVVRGEMTYAQGERMSMFLDLERLGLATSYYPRSVLAARRREARSLGMAQNDVGMTEIEIDLAQLLSAYRGAFERWPRAGVAALAEASGPPPPMAASEIAERLPGI
jgi:hypothetical protein